DWESPEYKQIYKNPLPIPPQKQPLRQVTFTNPINGKPIWYYEVGIQKVQQQIYAGKKPATLIGYDGSAPGPTFLVPVGTETIVRVINNVTDETSVHLHGSPSRAPFDGWAEDLTFPGQYKDYYWPNYQTGRFLWYHDHAMLKASSSAENAYFGLAGAYILNDPAEAALGLPAGYGTFDIPLVLSSKYYNSDGTLRSTKGELDSVWGDVIHVNGQSWPYMNVKPRKYRFRLLDASVSRNFALYFAKSSATSTKLPFKIIASDAGLLDEPVSAQTLFLSCGERYEVVFDFSTFAGQSVELRNLEDVGGVGTDDDYGATNKVMKFVVSSGAVQDSSVVPQKLRNVPFPPQTSGVDRRFKFGRSNGQWTINGVTFADVDNRILANVPRGTVEIWELENSSGGWTHPIHLHLVDFRVLSRSGGRSVLPYESHGLKDVVWLAKGETVTVEAHYLPWNGVYMFHCHNLIHEDHDMMAAFNVTALANFGYNETTDFSDPMDARWRAKAFSKIDFTSRTGDFSQTTIATRVDALARQQPYSELSQVLDAL
ncbi:Cupredoxin, partial [Microdochium trichocladiopsis]